MRLLQYLQEEFVTSAISYWSREKISTEIYCNPIRDDFLKLRKHLKATIWTGNIELRFIADPINQDLFMFSSANLTHYDAYQALKRDGYFKNSELMGCWQSFCWVTPNGRLVNQTGSKFEHYLLNPGAEGQDITGDQDWTWLRKYFK